MGSMEACFDPCGFGGEEAARITVHPNPTTDRLELKTKDAIDKSKVSITNQSGDKIKFSWNGNAVNVKALQPGTYLLHVGSKEGKIQTIRFVKL
jgi:hypothetical protein